MDLAQIAQIAWISLAVADLGCVVGGYLSPFFITRFKMSVVNSRRAVVACGAALMAGFASIGLARGAPVAFYRSWGPLQRMEKSARQSTLVALIAAGFHLAFSLLAARTLFGLVRFLRLQSRRPGAGAEVSGHTRYAGAPSGASGE
jgi:hypothetical protein